MYFVETKLVMLLNKQVYKKKKKKAGPEKKTGVSKTDVYLLSCTQIWQ